MNATATTLSVPHLEVLHLLGADRVSDDVNMSIGSAAQAQKTLQVTVKMTSVPGRALCRHDDAE
jgi:hypothetical protein